MDKVLVECYDIGGTNLRGAIFDYELNRLSFKHSIKTKKGDPKLFLDQIKQVSDYMRSNFTDWHIKIVSLCVPGPVENNNILEMPPIRIKEKIDIDAELSDRGRVYVINDIDAAVLAENSLGEGKDLESICVVTLSTGIGVGTMIDGKLIPGGEYGHNVLERNGPECSCGRNGCWAALSSGQGIEKAAKKIYGRKTSCEELLTFYNFRDEKAIELVEKIRDYNAHGFGNIINSICVDKIIIMGSIGLEQFDKVIPTKKEIKAYTINKIPDIVPTSLGENIGLLGAYIFAKDKLK